MNLWHALRPHLEAPYREASFKEALYIMVFRSDTRLGKAFNLVVILFILASITDVVLESLHVFGEHNYRALHVLEYIFTAFFTLEYAARIYCSPERRRYALSFYGIIDLVAILPVYIGLFLPVGRYLVVMRAFRLFRIFRVFKLFYFIDEGDMLLASIRQSMPKIAVFFVFVVVLVIAIGTVMYMVEGTQPNSEFTNIPVSIYWAIVTMTTVGYGDITPVTPLGRFLSAIIMLVGYTIIAVPTGIVTANMVKQNARTKGRTVKICKSCGRVTADRHARFCKHCGTKYDSDAPETKK
jgi:voltage-gated potassium channel